VTSEHGGALEIQNGRDESCPRGRQVYKRVLKVDASLLTTLYVFVDGEDGL